MDLLSSQTISNRSVCEGYYELLFEWPQRLAPTPGQFLTTKNSLGTDPLLRRPFAFSSWRAERGFASIIYQTRGKTTLDLASKRQGDALNLLGPLGNSFPEPKKETLPVLVAGGIGLGPILFLSEMYRLKSQRSLLLIGARNRGLLPGPRLIPDEDAVLCTDDGSFGYHGNPVDYLRSGEVDINSVTLFACGPWPMLSGCASLASEAGIECWVSMEQVMGCAVGACMGCVIRVTGQTEYARVCTEGPVFRSEEIRWK